jgi:putative PIN family toxin of toxin-antitoxin system
MRVVIDTNVLVSALLSSTSPPAFLVTLWRAGRFSLITSEPQLDELTRVTRYPKLRQRLSPALAGRLVNELRDIAEMVNPAPDVDVSPDPYDNYLLAMASAGRANSLITGDKRDLLLLKKYEATAIVTVSDFLSGLRHLHQFR